MTRKRKPVRRCIRRKKGRDGVARCAKFSGTKKNRKTQSKKRKPVSAAQRHSNRIKRLQRDAQSRREIAENVERYMRGEKMIGGSGRVMWETDLFTPEMISRFPKEEQDRIYADAEKYPVSEERIKAYEKEWGPLKGLSIGSRRRCIRRKRSVDLPPLAPPGMRYERAPEEDAWTAIPLAKRRLLGDCRLR